MPQFLKICITLMAFMVSTAMAECLPDGRKVTLATGGEYGTYYSFGQVLAKHVSESTSTYVTAITSGGSKDNIEALQSGKAQLAFIQDDVASYAYKGTRLFKEKFTDFATVGNLYMEQVQIITLDKTLSSVSDLKGKTVSVGAAGSGVYFNALDILGVYGLNIDADIKPTYQSFSDSMNALKEGKIDAAFIVAGAPTSAVMELAKTNEIKLIAIDHEHILKLLKVSPYYCSYSISKHVYNTQKNIDTVAVGAVIFARKDVSATDVYNFLCGIYGDIEEIRQEHDKGDELTMKFASSNHVVPYHKGALRFYEEKGQSINVKP